MAWRNLCAAAEAPLVVRIGKLLLTVLVAAAVVGIGALPLAISDDDAQQTAATAIRLAFIVGALWFWWTDWWARRLLALFLPVPMLTWGIARRYVWTAQPTAPGT